MCVLCGFSHRLQLTEVQLSVYQPVGRLDECPSSLDQFRSFYEGAPAVFPASWHAPWHRELAVGDDACALMRALGALVGDDAQVEVFQLTHDKEDGVQGKGQGRPTQQEGRVLEEEQKRKRREQGQDETLEERGSADCGASTPSQPSPVHGTSCFDGGQVLEAGREQAPRATAQGKARARDAPTHIQLLSRGRARGNEHPLAPAQQQPCPHGQGQGQGQGQGRRWGHEGESEDALRTAVAGERQGLEQSTGAFAREGCSGHWEGGIARDASGAEPAGDAAATATIPWWHPVARSKRRHMPFRRFAEMAVAGARCCGESRIAWEGQHEQKGKQGLEGEQLGVSRPARVESQQGQDEGVAGKSRRGALATPTLVYLTWRDLPAPREDLSELPHGLQRFFTNLLHPATTPPFIAGSSVRQRNLWAGTSSTSRIHFDALDNIHVLLAGSKVFHLYPPSDIDCLYPEPWTQGSLNNFSSLGSILLLQKGDPRWDHFMRAAHGQRAEVRAGEAIFIPRGWWHEVFTHQHATVSANIWFDAPLGADKGRLRPTIMHLASEHYYKFRCMQNKQKTACSNTG